MEDPRSERMSKWKDDELDTIRIYEEVGLMFPGTLTNGVNRFAEDVRSVTCPSVAGEFKTCYSTHHVQELFEQTGATANDLGYIRIDQLRRYREQFGESSHECLRLYLDRRILDISSVEASQDFVSKRCNVPYEVKYPYWTVTTFTIEELWKKRKWCKKSEVPTSTKRLFCNDPNWDGLLLLIDTRQFTTTNLTAHIPTIGIERLLKARMY